MKSLNRLIFSTMCTLLLVAGCSNADEKVNNAETEANKAEEENVTVEGSYAGIVMINGVEYIAQNIIANDEFTIKEQIGEVKKEVDKEQVPTEDWDSNAYEEGTKIYSANEKNDIYLIEARENEYTLLVPPGYFAEENSKESLVREGYVKSITPDTFTLLSELKDSNADSKNINSEDAIIIRTQKMSKEQISVLKVGQKVKVTYSSGMMYSDPPQVFGIDVEIISEK